MLIVPVDHVYVDANLNKLGCRLLEALMSEPIVALMRIVTGEAGRFPELGDLFHQRGLGYGWGILKEFLDGELERGKIRGGVDTLQGCAHVGAGLQELADRVDALAQVGGWGRLTHGPYPPP